MKECGSSCVFQLSWLWELLSLVRFFEIYLTSINTYRGYDTAARLLQFLSFISFWITRKEGVDLNEFAPSLVCIRIWIPILIGPKMWENLGYVFNLFNFFIISRLDHFHWLTLTTYFVFFSHENPKPLNIHSMARANLKKSVWLVTNTTAASK